MRIAASSVGASDPGSARSAPAAALVYGLGASGRSAARLLLGRGARVWGYDDAPIDRQRLAVEGLEPVQLLEADSTPPAVELVVLSPGVPSERPWLSWARQAGIPIVAEVELAFSMLQGEVVAITGSNGKSTTTAMTGALLASAGRVVEVCGNIGEPLSSKVEGASERVFVVELSSFQLESVDTFRPRVAALLNLAADHLDRHGDFATYAEIKARIFRRQLEGDVAVLNADDPRVAEVAIPAGVRKRFFSRQRVVQDGCYVEEERVLETEGSTVRELFKVADLPVPGPHNVENAMAAALIASSLGVESGRFAEALRDFRPLPHRLEKVRSVGGVEYYDDSKGTNVAATLRSLESFGDRSVHLILGGRNKDADLGELRVTVGRKALAVYLIGEAAAEIEKALAGVVDCHRCKTLERAVAESARSARPKETVLLSPACSSFDQFENFLERGRRFATLVETLAVPAARVYGEDFDG